MGSPWGSRGTLDYPKPSWVTLNDQRARSHYLAVFLHNPTSSIRRWNQQRRTGLRLFPTLFLCNPFPSSFVFFFSFCSLILEKRKEEIIGKREDNGKDRLPIVSDSTQTGPSYLLHLYLLFSLLALLSAVFSTKCLPSLHWGCFSSV